MSFAISIFALGFIAGFTVMALSIKAGAHVMNLELDQREKELDERERQLAYREHTAPCRTRTLNTNGIW